MRWKKNIIRTMNRVAVVGGGSVGGGVAHSPASRIPWQKRIAGTAIQSGGGGWKERYGLEKKMLKNQKGGGSTWYYFKRGGDRLTGRGKRQKGGFLKDLERSMFGVRRTKGKKKRKPQKGGFWGALERQMFGVKRTKGKRKRKPKQKGGL